MKRATMEISYHCLRQLLGFPEDIEIIWTVDHRDREVVKVLLEGESLPSQCRLPDDPNGRVGYEIAPLNPKFTTHRVSVFKEW